MRIRTIAAIALALAASGCITPAEQRAIDEARCSSYGFRPKTDGFASCLLDVDLDRSANRRAQLNYSWGPGWYGGYGYGFRRW